MFLVQKTIINEYIEALDVSWNKIFIVHIIELYGKWLASGVHQYFTAENMKAAW